MIYMFEAEQENVMNGILLEEAIEEQPQPKREFSKTLLVQESVLIWVMTLAFLGLAALCIVKDYTGSLPWLAAMVSFPWTAYGVSQACYYHKAKKENTQGGIKYESVMAELENELSNSPQTSSEQSDAWDAGIDINYGI